MHADEAERLPALLDLAEGGAQQVATVWHAIGHEDHFRDRAPAGVFAGQFLRAGRHVPEDAVRRERAAIRQRIERRQIDE